MAIRRQVQRIVKAKMMLSAYVGRHTKEAEGQLGAQHGYWEKDELEDEGTNDAK